MVKTDVNTMKNDINGIGGKVDKLRNIVDENEAKQARVRILRFSDELLNNIPHGEEHYVEILRCCDSYEEYCAAHPNFKNSVAENSINEIKKSYEEHRQKQINMFYINISKPYSKIIPEMDVYCGRQMNTIKSEFYSLRKGGKSY